VIGPGLGLQLLDRVRNADCMPVTPPEVLSGIIQRHHAPIFDVTEILMDLLLQLKILA